jgi:aerotaxis receptor
LRKDGKFYWVETEVLPSKDENGNITGFVAARKPASVQEVKETSETYRKMKKQEL